MKSKKNKPSQKAAKTVKIGRGRPPAAEAEGYRQRILEVTTAVFLEMGFERGSTNEIARRAQTSKQTLYSLYPSKAELFLAVMRAHTEKTYSQHDLLISAGLTPRQGLIEVGKHMLRIATDPAFLALYRVTMSVSLKFPELAQTVRHDCVERGYQLVAKYLQFHKIGGPNYSDSAELFCLLVLRDFVTRALVNPGLTLSRQAIHARVQRAVEVFGQLFPLD